MRLDKPGKKILRPKKPAPRLEYLSDNRKTRRTPKWMWLGVSSVLLVLFLLVTLPVWAKWARFIIPDRYIAAYAPEVVAAWAFESNEPLEDLPSVQAVNDQQLEELEALIDVTPLPPTITPTPTATPRLEPTIPVRPGNAPMRSNVNPTVTPTATNVPVAARNAVDGTGEANLDEAITLLTGFTHSRQGWNNCGPASMLVTMSYFGVELTQSESAAALKPNPEDRNVRPDELQRYAGELGFDMLYRVDGDVETLKRLLDGGYPVLVEKGFEPEVQFDWAGHYLTLTGYTNDAFIAMDTYLGPNRAYPYEALDIYWRQFNRTYLVAFPPRERAIVLSIIGELEDNQMWESALLTAQNELAQDSEDAFGWFNLGSTLTELGRYDDASVAFDRALEIGLPGRMLWYQFGPYEAYYRTGRYEDVMTLANATLATNPMSEEAHYYKGLVYMAEGSTAQARGQFQEALRLNRNYVDAQSQLDLLES